MKKFKTEEEKVNEINRLFVLHTENKNKLGIKQGSWKWIVMSFEEATRLKKELDIKLSGYSVYGRRGYPVLDGIEITNCKMLLAFFFVKIKHIF